MNRTLAAFLALGLYLTVRGYHSRDGDQAYRLPLLLHRQDASLFAHDPFVKALDAFNPHRGYLTLLDVTSRPFGLSVALFALFAITFGITCLAIDRLARAVWPDSGARVGVVAVLLVLAAKAGNIGTNHLFEAMLLDRLIAFALGWVAFAATIAHPERGKWVGAAAIGMAGLIHPSLGLQLGMLAGAGWVIWACVRKSGISFRSATLALGLLAAALLPTTILTAGAGSRLFEGLSPADFLRISASIQSPQHMLPHLWRTPQWLAWACYPALALLSLRHGFDAGPRARLTMLLMVNLVGLGIAWIAIEPLHSRFATTFQPFRMATVARGLCLILIANRVQSLWFRGDARGRLRAALIVAGLGGDWSLVVVTLVELSVLVPTLRVGMPSCTLRVPGMPAPATHIGMFFHRRSERGNEWLAAASLSLGLVFLACHDTESGHVRLLAAAGISIAVGMLWPFLTSFRWNRRRILAATLAAWLVPVVAMMVPAICSEKTVQRVAANWRFAEYPSDDVERLAMWCREHTPPGSRFVTPPGPKTFRLWSRREVAFNRASSPYHALGLSDWLGRFQDHVKFRGTVNDFALAYLHDRQALERRYQEMSDADRADLARRQGADYVVAAAPDAPRGEGPLTLLHVEGRFAVYQVKLMRDSRVVSEKVGWLGSSRFSGAAPGP